MKQSCHAYISGTVQGVFFRASTKQQADRLGITGWIRNTADGRVELQATGSPEQLAEFKQWCHQGPQAAAVTAVDWQMIETVDYKHFEIRYGD